MHEKFTKLTTWILTSGSSQPFRIYVNIKGAWILISYRFLQATWHRARITLHILSQEAECLTTIHALLNIKCQGWEEYKYTICGWIGIRYLFGDLICFYFTFLISFFCRPLTTMSNDGDEQKLRMIVKMETWMLSLLRFPDISFLLIIFWA